MTSGSTFASTIFTMSATPGENRAKGAFWAAGASWLTALEVDAAVLIALEVTGAPTTIAPATIHAAVR